MKKYAKQAKDAASSLTQKNSFFTILVVDGEASEAGLFEDFLKAEGHFVLRAESAEDALAKAHKFQPDLILLGCDIPGVSCLELLPRLLMVQSSAAVIMLADKPTIRDAVTAMKIGAMDFIQTPLDLKKLKESIDFQKALFK